MSPFVAELLFNLSTDGQALLDIDRFRKKDHLTFCLRHVKVDILQS